MIPTTMENYLYKMPSTIPGSSRENRSHAFNKPAQILLYKIDKTTNNILKN